MAGDPHRLGGLKAGLTFAKKQEDFSSTTTSCQLGSRLVKASVFRKGVNRKLLGLFGTRVGERG